jgi:16S rRNA (guanine(1405)-N(7))-methyltransferase
VLPVEEVVQAVLASAKYAEIDPALAAEVAAQELAKGARAKDAIKQVKRRLHQSVAAYWDGRADFAAWRTALDAAPDAASLRAALLPIMQAHHSTRERLPILDEFYHTIFDGLGPIRSVLDLGCGLNPLALPWMKLPADAAYFACDVDRAQMDFLAWWLEKSGRRGRAFVWNLLDGAPHLDHLLAHDSDAETQRRGAVQRKAEERPLSVFLPPPDSPHLRVSASRQFPEPLDVALLLKLVPCLEQLDRRIGERLLDEATARVLIVSFPAQSLGGRRKGMIEHYTAHMDALLEGRGWGVERFVFASELLFRLHRNEEMSNDS